MGLSEEASAKQGLLRLPLTNRATGITSLSDALISLKPGVPLHDLLGARIAPRCHRLTVFYFVSNILLTLAKHGTIEPLGLRRGKP